MPKQGVFKLQGPHEGKTMVILDKYPFVDGVFKTQPHNALLMSAILCGSYGCSLSYEGSDQVEESRDGDEEGSLSIKSTRGLTEGDKMANQDMYAKIEHAKRQEEAEAQLAEQRAAERAILDAKQAKAPVVQADVEAIVKAATAPAVADKK